MKTKEVRVPATSVELIQILGRIIEERIQIKTLGLGWTIQFDTDEANSPVTSFLLRGSCTKDKIDWISTPMDRLNITAHCERGWSQALLLWDIQIWIEYPSGYVDRYYYVCDRDLAHCTRIFDPTERPWKTMSEEPPTKIIVRQR